METPSPHRIHQESKTDLEAALRDICRRYDVVAMYAFGSRGEEIAARMRGADVPAGTADSDVDIGVLPAPEIDLGASERVDLMQALEDLLGVARVDLVILPEADPFLAANVVRGERLYAEDAYLADEYDLYVLRRAGDLIPLERERIALVLGESR